MCFYTKNAQTVNDLHKIPPIIDGTILTFVPDNLPCFHTKNSQKVDILSHIASIIQYAILTFVPDNPLENVPLCAI